MSIHPSVIELVRLWGPGRFVFQQRINHGFDDEAYIFRWVPKGCDRSYITGWTISIRPQAFWGTA